MIELIEGLPGNVIAVDCKGHVTKLDYEQVLIPAVDSALKTHDNLRLYYRVGPDFKGIDPGALFEDIKVGFSHLSRWERVAIVTDVEWIRATIRALAFLIPGPVRLFKPGEEREARDWIASETLGYAGGATSTTCNEKNFERRQ